jgi:hypothetical protein
MPITVELTLYQYHELEGKAKEKAKQWWLGCWDENDNRRVTQLFKDALEEAGYPADDIGWSLSYCQGDGMAFYTNKNDGGNLRRIWLRRIASGWSKEDRRSLYKILAAEELEDCFWLTITRNSFGHHYSHHNTMVADIEHENFECEVDDFDLLMKFKDRLVKDIQDDVRDLSRELATKGYEEIEDMQSDESVESVMEANEYTFTKDGTRHD